MLSRKMSGDVKYMKIEKMSKQLQEISEIISSYDIMQKLSKDDISKHVAIAQTFASMTIQGETIETILGKNYRINSFKDGSIEFNFKEKFYGYDKAESVKNALESFPFNPRVSMKSKGHSLFEVSCNMKLGKLIEFDNVMKIISELKIG